MFNKILLIITLSLLWMPVSAVAITAVELKEKCLGEEISSTDSTTCLYYIIATREALEWGASVATYRYKTEGQSNSEIVQQAYNNLRVCIPRDVTNRTMITRVFNFLRVSNDLENTSATRAIYNALTLSYPCDQ